MAVPEPRSRRLRRDLARKLVARDHELRRDQFEAASNVGDELDAILSIALTCAESGDMGDLEGAERRLQYVDASSLQVIHPPSGRLIAAARGWVQLCRSHSDGDAAALTDAVGILEHALRAHHGASDGLQGVLASGLIIGLADLYFLRPSNALADRVLNAASRHFDERPYRGPQFPEDTTTLDLDTLLAMWKVKLAAKRLSQRTRFRLTCRMARAAWGRYEFTSRIQDLNIAITHYTAALNGPDREFAVADDYLEAATTHAKRYEIGLDATDLDLAYSYAQTAVARGNPNETAHAARIGELSTIHQMRYAKSANEDDLASAITLLASARAMLTPEHDWWPLATCNYSSLIYQSAVNEDDDEKFSKALSLARTAAVETPIGILSSNYICGYGQAFAAAYERDLAQDMELDYVIGLLEAFIVNSADRDRDWSLISRTLERCLRARHRHTSKDSDLLRISELALRRSNTPTAEAHEKAESLVRAAHAFAELGDWEAAADQFEAAIRTYESAASQALTRLDQEHLLEGAAHLASYATGSVLQQQDPDLDRAVRLFAEGKGLVSRMVPRRASQLERLRTATPEAVTEYIEATRVYDDLRRQLSAEWGGALPTPATVEAFHQATANVRELQASMGLGHHALPPMHPPWSDAQASYPDDPIACIAASRYGIYALVLSSMGLDVVYLEVDSVSVLDAVTALLDAGEGRPGGESPADAAEDDPMESALRLLGHGIFSPPVQLLLEHGIDLREHPIRWCLTGALNLVPVAATHFEQRYPDAESNNHAPHTRLIDVADGYSTPNVWTKPLDFKPTDLSPALLVAMAHTPGMRPLLRAVDEIRVVEQEVQPQECTVLGNTSANPANVAEHLASARFAHFACHVTGELNRPESVRIALADDHTERLTAARISASRYEGNLLFLSACGTARASGRLPDDPFDIASTFQLAGFHNVVATLWDVRDDDSHFISQRFYQELCAAGADQPCHPERALRTAQQALRAECGDDVRRWGSHVLLRG